MRFQDRSGARHLFGRSVRHDDKSIGLERSLVMDYVILRNARVEERGAQRTDTAYYNRTFDSGHHDGCEITHDDDRSDDW